MRFALLGNHPDGVELACAVALSGRHSLVAHTGGLDESARQVLSGARQVSDLEEILADPQVEAVIVAGPPAVRPAQLRRAVQSERHVLCLHPSDETPEVAYEVGMMQRDTGFALFPVLPAALHPAVRRLGQLIERGELGSSGPGVGQTPFAYTPGSPSDAPGSPVGAFRLLEVELASPGEVLHNVELPGNKPGVPGWEVLRALGGEVVEVSGFADQEAVEPGQPLLLAGRFERGGLFQVTLLPQQRDTWRLAVVGSRSRAELEFPQGPTGPAFLNWRDEGGLDHEESWEAWDPWPAVLEAFEVAATQPRRAPGPWQDEVRALELDEAVRRSVEKRRSNLLEYQEASEEVGFKGTMTLAGCALLWVVLAALVIAGIVESQWAGQPGQPAAPSRWLPVLGWLILPVLLVFIVLQVLRYAIPPRPRNEQPPAQAGSNTPPLVASAKKDEGIRP